MGTVKTSNACFSMMSWAMRPEARPAACSASRWGAAVCRAAGDVARIRLSHAFQHVVSVHQQDGFASEVTVVAAEGRLFAREGHDEAVRLRAGDGDAQAMAGLDVGGAGAAAYVGSACGQDGGVGPVRAARAKVHHRPVPAVRAGSLDDPGRLCCHQRLVVHHAQQECLHHLGLDDRRLHAQEGLVGEGGRALRHGAERPGEAELAQVIEELAADARQHGQGAQVADLLAGEAQVLEVGDGLLQARAHQV
jgi:hypothetical protein